MSQLELESSPFRAPLAPKSGLWARVETWQDRSSEWLNPILVKEARQALKSRQFIITFTLLLLCGWGWSIAGVSMLSQAAYYAPGGRFMLIGYFLILAVPLIVIVPFSAFRSLAAEREDGTFELLSITALASRQIVSGKLGSAVVQMMVYYSALAPCIAFTYLLRGIDVVTIGYLLYCSLLVSLLLSQFGLIVATATRASHWQIVLSVLLILFLAWCDGLFSIMIVEVISSPGNLEFDASYFWITNLAILTFFLSTMAMFQFAAAAQISFPSDNRSTKLRVVMLVQQLLWIGWMTYLWTEVRDADVLYAVAPFACGYWFVVGSLMTGEDPQLSPRVKRALPQSFLGRTFLTWFNPGSGTGYTFAVLNAWTVAIFASLCGIIAEVSALMGRGRLDQIISGSTLGAAYVTIYLGLGRIIVRLLRRHLTAGVLLPLLINVILAVLGIFVPFAIMGWREGFGGVEYNEIQITNWAWTTSDAYFKDIWTTPLVPLGVYATAGILFVTNLVLAMREIEQVRAETPQRVLEDEWALHPEKHPVAPKPRSPWSDDEFEAAAET